MRDDDGLPSPWSVALIVAVSTVCSLLLVSAFKDEPEQAGDEYTHNEYVHNETTVNNYTTSAPTEPVVVEEEPSDTLTVDQEMDAIHDNLEDDFASTLETWGI